MADKVNSSSTRSRSSRSSNQPSSPADSASQISGTRAPSVKIFFSHSSRDKPLLREVVRNLPSEVRAWIDEKELRIGHDLYTSIRSAIATEADFVVIFVGPEAVQSKWVRRELDWARRREEELNRVFVLPVIVDRNSWNQLPRKFQNRKYLTCSDFTEVGISDFSKRLVDELSSLVTGLSIIPRQALESEDKARLRERVRKIAMGVADDQTGATGKGRLTKQRLELIVSSLDAMRKVELLSVYELQFGKFRDLYLTQDIVTPTWLRIEATFLDGRTFTHVIDWSASPFSQLQEEYGLGDRKYAVRDVFIKGIAKLTEIERSEIFSGITISRCSFA